MAKVHGIGGFIVYSRQPETVRQWYADHLGIVSSREAEGAAPWHEFLSRDDDDPERRRRLVWSVVEQGSDVMQGARVSYLVDDLDEMVSSLRASDVEVDGIHEFDYGRFAYVSDPDGTRVELFQDKRSR